MIVHAVSFVLFLRDLLHPFTGPSSMKLGGYLAWSGLLGCGFIGGGIWANFAHRVRQHNCHVHGCPFIGRYHLADGKYVVCKRHHRHITGIDKLTKRHIRAEHLNGGSHNHDTEVGRTTSDGSW